MINLSADIAVILDMARERQCQQLAERLQLPLVSVDGATAYPYVLAYIEQGLSLQQTGAKAAGPVLVNFDAGGTDHRRKYGGG